VSTFSHLKDHEDPPKLDEIAIASRKKQLDGSTEAEYLGVFERSAGSIKRAIVHQKARAEVSDDILSISTNHY
jgi:hypothetical protein